MKIVRQTYQQLILRLVPWVMAILLSTVFLGTFAIGLNAVLGGNVEEGFWALLFVPAFVGLFMIVFIRRDEVILDRSRDLIELRHATFFKRRKIQHELSNLSHAVLQSSRTSKGGTTYRIALVLDGGMDKGTHPVTPIYVGGNSAKRGVEAINAWLEVGSQAD